MSNIVKKISPIMSFGSLGVPRVITTPEHFNTLVAQFAEALYDHGVPVTLHALVLHMGFVNLAAFERYPQHKGENYIACIERTKYIAECYLVNEIAASDKPESGKQFILKAVHGFTEKQEIEMKSFTVMVDGKDITC